MEHKAQDKSSKAIQSLIAGILSIISSLIIMLFGLIIGLYGLIIGLLSIKDYQNGLIKNKKRLVWGITLSSFGILLSILLSILAAAQMF
ncbi:hypothetical protein [Salisediminibacterium halotolerans]|uniref:DUF4190 domain-containing protein n=1 Tax=Salisediminibacterium halotolerans TaxID=517425 RepID=A0A1H9SZ01_9BACI|nr:hypothetical protein [Salisediminibacterium haloalkalitolerans]SER90116.1 hypothetical protein SAMN05444126_10873 [Salisediminibacterium haloalkalitolerans]